MNHGNKHWKLNMRAGHRKALFLNLLKSLVLHKRIKTTLPKARAIRVYGERIITKAIHLLQMKDANYLAAYRNLLSEFHQDEKVVKILIEEVAPKCANRPGGYTRIVKLNIAHNAWAVIEFVDFYK